MFSIGLHKPIQVVVTKTTDQLVNIIHVSSWPPQQLKQPFNLRPQQDGTPARLPVLGRPERAPELRTADQRHEVERYAPPVVPDAAPPP